jgi:hypothetical protein
MFRASLKTAVALAVALMALPRAAIGRGPPDLRLGITYTGKGDVEEAHRIWIFFWADSDFDNSMPIAFRSVAENGAEIDVSGLRVSPVFITCVYDVEGGYDPVRAMGPPPLGSPRGAYFGDPPGPTPAPVELEEGETVIVEFSFGDAGATTPG